MGEISLNTTTVEMSRMYRITHHRVQINLPMVVIPVRIVQLYYKGKIITFITNLPLGDQQSVILTKLNSFSITLQHCQYKHEQATEVWKPRVSPQP